MASTLQHHQTTQFFGLQTTSTTDHTTTAKDTCNARRRHDTMTLDSLNLGGIGPRGRSLGLDKSHRRAVEDTHKVLSRLVKLTPVKGEGDEALYETANIFKALAAKGHEFPAMVKEALRDRDLISSGKRHVRSQPHGNTERFENDRIQVMQAMISVLADPVLHPTCRENAAIDGPVVGIALARTIVVNRQALFDGGKLPQQPETIAKLFNEIVPPQVR